jgi:hypothetical protein
MKIVKRKKVWVIGSELCFWGPTVTYFYMSIQGLEFQNEWVWWITAPISILVWALLNWTIKK